MPIRASERARYPKNWKVISDRIRFDRACGKCECTGQCGVKHERAPAILPPAERDRCNALHGEHVLRNLKEPWRWITSEEFQCWEVYQIRPDEWKDKSVKIVLTTAHLDHTPEHCEDDNLLAMCQYCHLRMDRGQHTATARATRRAHRAIGDLFEGIE